MIWKLNEGNGTEGKTDTNLSYALNLGIHPEVAAVVLDDCGMVRGQSGWQCLRDGNDLPRSSLSVLELTPASPVILPAENLILLTLCRTSH